MSEPRGGTYSASQPFRFGDLPQAVRGEDAAFNNPPQGHVRYVSRDDEWVPCDRCKESGQLRRDMEITSASGAQIKKRLCVDCTIALFEMVHTFLYESTRPRCEHKWQPAGSAHLPRERRASDGEQWRDRNGQLILDRCVMVFWCPQCDTLRSKDIPEPSDDGRST